VGATDDPIHPFDIATRWARALPNSGLAEVALDEIGADPAVLGRRAVAALPAI
jgi:hypothetical protein